MTKLDARDERGFSLVEVLVAGAILVVTILAMAGMSTSAYRALGRSGNATAAVALGQQRIEWLRNQAYTSTAMLAGTITETLTGTYAGYSRTTTIQDNTPQAGIKTITVTTATPSGLSAQVVALIVQH